MKKTNPCGTGSNSQTPGDFFSKLSELPWTFRSSIFRAVSEGGGGHKKQREKRKREKYERNGLRKAGGQKGVRFVRKT